MRRSTASLLLVAALVSACGGKTPLSDDAREGRALVLSLGCDECHGEDDQIGPSWGGTWGTLRPLVGGSTVVFDAEYVRTSLLDPGGQVVQGFDPVMPAFSLSDGDLAAIVAYLEESS